MRVLLRETHSADSAIPPVARSHSLTLKLKNDKAFTWKALRLMAKKDVSLLAKVRRPLDDETCLV